MQTLAAAWGCLLWACISLWCCSGDWPGKGNKTPVLQPLASPAPHKPSGDTGLEVLASTSTRLPADESILGAAHPVWERNTSVAAGWDARAMVLVWVQLAAQAWELCGCLPVCLPVCLYTASAYRWHNCEELFPACRAVARPNYLVFMENLIH